MTRLPQQHPDDLLKSLGAITAAGAALEWMLIDLHELLLNSPWAHVAVAGETFDNARKACLQLARYRDDGTLDGQVRVAVAKAASAWEERGAVIHSMWAASVQSMLPEGTSLAMRMRSTGLLHQHWTYDQLTAVADRLEAATLSISLVCIDVGALNDGRTAPTSG